jgi:hypothetical protein
MVQWDVVQEMRMETTNSIVYDAREIMQVFRMMGWEFKACKKGQQEKGWENSKANRYSWRGEE